MNKFKYHFLWALVFIWTTVFGYIGYALWTDIPTQDSWATMTADIWNNMVTSVNWMAATVNSLISTVDNLSTKLSWTYTANKMCISDATWKIQCNTDMPVAWGWWWLPSNSQTFTANWTFTVPTGVTKIMLVWWHSGAGWGGGGGNWNNTTRWGGGAPCVFDSPMIIDVTWGETFNVIIWLWWAWWAAWVWFWAWSAWSPWWTTSFWSYKFFWSNSIWAWWSGINIWGSAWNTYLNWYWIVYTMASWITWWTSNCNNWSNGWNYTNAVWWKWWDWKVVVYR